jgi:hypothetical protein
MITLVLHLLRLVPFLCGGHRQLALENLALRQQLAVYKRTVTGRHYAELIASLGRAGQGLGRVETATRDRNPGHGPAVAATPLPRVLDQALPSANRGLLSESDQIMAKDRVRRIGLLVP